MVATTVQLGHMHTSTPTSLAEFGRKTDLIPKPPDSRENPAVGIAPDPRANIGQKRLADFDLNGKVFIVTGGARGLGLSLAEALAETGGKGTFTSSQLRGISFSEIWHIYLNDKLTVYCFDREAEADEQWSEAARRAIEFGGSLNYKQQDVQDIEGLDEAIAEIADKHLRLDGVIAAAGVQHLSPAIEWTKEEVTRMMDINFTGVMMTATSAARQMFKYKIHGSMCFIASMSGSVANKGLLSPVRNLIVPFIKS